MSVLDRAGGLTSEAYPGGIRVSRRGTIVAADIDNSSARTASLYRPCGSSRPIPSATSSPWVSKASSWVRIETARYLPHWPPLAAQTCRSTSRAS